MKKPFVTLLNIYGMLKSISNFTGDSRLMKVTLNLPDRDSFTIKIAVNGIPTAYEIVRNDDQFDKFKSLVVLYNKQNFKCLE